MCEIAFSSPFPESYGIHVLERFAMNETTFNPVAI